MCYFIKALQLMWRATAQGILRYLSPARLCIRFSYILVYVFNQINSMSCKDIDCFDFAI